MTSLFLGRNSQKSKKTVLNIFCWRTGVFVAFASFFLHQCKFHTPICINNGWLFGRTIAIVLSCSGTVRNYGVNGASLKQFVVREKGYNSVLHRGNQRIGCENSSCSPYIRSSALCPPMRPPIRIRRRLWLSHRQNLLQIISMSIMSFVAPCCRIAPALQPLRCLRMGSLNVSRPKKA